MSANSEPKQEHPAAPTHQEEVRRLTDEFTEAAAMVSAAQVEMVRIAEQLLDHEAHVSCALAAYLSLHAGISSAEAKQILRLAKGVRAVPLIDEVFTDGRLSIDTADALVKHATVENQADLLTIAAAATGNQLRTILGTYRKLQQADRPAPDRDESVHYGSDDTDMWTLRARLQPLHGAELETALRLARDELHQEQRAAGAVSDEVDAKVTAGARPPIGSADAIQRIVHGYLESRTNATGQLPARHLAIINLQLTDHDVALTPEIRKNLGGDPGPLSAITRPTIDPDTIAQLRGIGPLPGSDVSALLCDALLSVVTTRHGIPMTVTLPQRLASPAQRIALLAAHPTCQFPGCGRTAYLRAHHVRPAGHGGPTKLANLALVCDACHTKLHLPGWRNELTPDRVLLVWTPDGQLLNTGALRSAAPNIQKSDRPTPTADASQRIHGLGDPLTEFALDCCLQTLLADDEHTKANAEATGADTN